MKARKVTGLDPAGTVADQMELIARVRLDELCSFSPRVLDPAEVDALHDMRIAAKRLRYVLELAHPCFGRQARLGAEQARALQDLLGEIHDCDEMLPAVARHAERLRDEDAAAVTAAAGDAGDLAPGAAGDAPNLDRYRGLEALSTYLRARRRVLYARFVQEWARLERQGFRETLEGGLARRALERDGPSRAGIEPSSPRYDQAGAASDEQGAG